MNVNLYIYFRLHTVIACESIKVIHLSRAGIRKPKTEDDVEVLQSTETIKKAPILNFLETLAQRLFVENDQDNDDN